MNETRQAGSRRLWGALLFGLHGTACLGMPSPLAPGLEGSIGAPHRGVQTGAVELPRRGSGYERYRPKGDQYWGNPRLVSMIVAAAARLRAESPSASPLVVGDLSARYGGKVPRHVSHRNGRDADLLFYVTTPSGAPRRSPGFVSFAEDGLAEVREGAFIRFDVERNWQLVKVLLESEHASLQWLFISRDLEALLIDYARARGEDLELVWHAENVLKQPSTGLPHRDHFHLRIACTHGEAVAGCEGGGPRWPWLPEEPALEPPTAVEWRAIAADDPFVLEPPVTPTLEGLETTARSASVGRGWRVLLTPRPPAASTAGASSPVQHPDRPPR